ncbi:MAG TPA: ABC-type transport auxiliary lipoprotein family protein [Candidatus Acidoferrum sp.]|nr:ABC-type transport auxiliary lipoprotein family protein [Candidatus Acidoferrum sp.]
MKYTPRRLENRTYFTPVPGERTRRMRFPLALAAFALLLAGCGHMQPVKYYEITYPAVGPVKQEPLNATLLVRAFATSHLYREDRIVYGSDSEQMGTYQNERWSEPPAEMLQNALVRELRSTGRFRTVTALRSDSNGDFLLTGHLYDFKEVSGNGIVARISFDAELRDLKAGKTVWTYTYNHDEPSSGKGVAAVVAAMDRNVQRSAQEVEAGILQALVAYPMK